MSLVAGFMFIIIIPKVQYLCTVIEKQDMPLPVPPVRVCMEHFGKHCLEDSKRGRENA